MRSFLGPVHALAPRPANIGTAFGVPAARSFWSFEDSFKRVFPRLRPLDERLRRDGLLALAVWDNDQVTDYRHVPIDASDDEPELLTIGRHLRCDLLLSQDPTTSLRHAVVMADPRDGDLRLRLLDLRSGSGFATEEGLPCESLSADGALFVRIGGFHLFLLPTGRFAPLPWGRNADEAWSAFPERVYHDCRAPQRAPDVWTRVPEPSPPAANKRSTIVTSILEPPGALRPPRRKHLDGRGHMGALELRAAGGIERHPVTEADLDRGVLVGRYERCELGVGDDTLSRVHLLLVRRGDALWAIDTASSNGTTKRGAPVRKTRLLPHEDLVLAETVALRWVPQERGSHGG